MYRYVRNILPFVLYLSRSESSLGANVILLVCRAPAFIHVYRYEPGHEKICLMSYANNKGADQPAHPRSLISAFVFRCLDSIISLDSIAEISRL